MPVSADVQDKWLDSLMDTTGNNKRFIIEIKDDIPIGMIGLYNINWIHRSCELITPSNLSNRSDKREAGCPFSIEQVRRIH